MATYAKRVHELLLKKKITFSLAESCTGGALSSTLVQFPNASNYFLGSVVAYSNSSKIRILNVKEETLRLYGAVSPETASEMAQGSLSLFGSDFALSVTGVAGPSGGTEIHPVGTVFFSIAGKENFSWKESFKGNRKEIIFLSVQSSFEKFYQILNHF
jgi:PncC family amidohydrolase